MRKAIFINKDGGLVENIPDKWEASLLRLKPFASEALKMLQAAGYLIIVVAEHPDLAHGLEESSVERIRQYLEALLMMFNVRISGYYYCPHDPAGSVASYARACDCRKPAAGLLLRAAADHQIDLGASWFIGCSEEDLVAARRARCR